MPPGIPGGAMCVQRFDDSLNSAIHITYRISLRSSSMPEPRDPLLKVLILFNHVTQNTVFKMQRVLFGSSGGPQPVRAVAPPKQQDRYVHMGLGVVNSVMIPPLVHQRRPCYDFYFL